jgi:hypothetical protein
MNLNTEIRRGDPKSSSPALIGMSLRQNIPGGLLSSRARFRFSCHDHSETKAPRCQQKGSELQSVPSCRVSKIDTPHSLSARLALDKLGSWVPRYISIRMLRHC